MTRPNVLLIANDQHHWSALESQDPEIQTPNLDRLAEQGTLFDRAYCVNPTCTPTRAWLIASRNPRKESLTGARP
jgi:uncharacterized sulfatase